VAYVDIEYYYDKFGGNIESEQDAGKLTKLLREASDQVDRLTYGRIRRKGFDNLTEYQQEMIKKAVCHQADFLDNYGEYLNSPIDSFSVGDINMSFSGANQGAGGIVADRKTLDCLVQTGLTVRRL